MLPSPPMRSGLGHDATFVRHRNPWCIGHDVSEDLAPGCCTFSGLCWIRHRVSRNSTLVQFGVAIPRPVPAALHRTTTAKDRAVEVRRIREVGNPGHAARPDHRRFTFRAACGDDVGLGQRAQFSLDANGGKILLDRLRHAGLRIGVGGIEHRLEAIGKPASASNALALSTS